MGRGHNVPRNTQEEDQEGDGGRGETSRGGEAQREEYNSTSTRAHTGESWLCVGESLVGVGTVDVAWSVGRESPSSGRIPIGDESLGGGESLCNGKASESSEMYAEWSVMGMGLRCRHCRRGGST